MKRPFLALSVLAFVFLLASMADVNAQVVEKVKDTAEKTKDVTVDAVRKTKVVVTDAFDKGEAKAENAKDVSGEAGKKAASSVKTLGNHTVTVSDNVTEAAVKQGRYHTVSTWDGTKWVAKKVWFPTKKAADKAKETVTGDDSPDQ